MEKEMKFLIPTEPDDVHAILVKLALEKMEHQSTLIFTADQPTRQKNSVYIDIDRYHWKSLDKYGTVFDHDYDVIWWRRPRKPYLPKTLVHPDDYKFVVRENNLFYESFTHNLAPNAWWINSKESAHRANFKLLQLKIASECGMTIPTTLCSNDPQEIRCFMLKYKTSGVIYKPLCSNFWFEDERVKISYTSRIDYWDLPNNQSLQRTPGIFQNEIQKKYELRITCFGDHIVAAKLNSQVHKNGEVDWRAIEPKALRVEPYDLPEDLAHKIRQFMREIGIVFGSFDFIVTPDDEYIFLEVNEQGQFLWIEEYNADFKMLDTFIQFMLNKSPDFSLKNHQAIHSIADYNAEIAPFLNQHMQRHVSLNSALSQT